MRFNFTRGSIDFKNVTCTESLETADTDNNLGEIGLMVSIGVTTTELLNELSDGPYVPKTR